MQWRALIPEELLQKSGMTLVKTAYSNHQNKIFAQFQCESPLEYGELQLVEDCLRKPFERPEELEAQFVFCGGEKWLQQGTQTEEYLLRALGEAHSALRPMLHEIALHLDGGALTAVLPSEAACKVLPSEASCKVLPSEEAPSDRPLASALTKAISSSPVMVSFCSRNRAISSNRLRWEAKTSLAFW